MARLPPLSPTGRVILGMIAKGRRSGYEIKQLVDKSTRYFWAASYGQIYPELRRLEEDGLIRGRPDPSGARAKMAHELTPLGERALRDWLNSDEGLLWELRDEAMLKLFFSDLEPGTALRTLRAMRQLHERKLEALEDVHQHASHMSSGPRLTLELGIGLASWLIEWSRSAEERVAEEMGLARDPDAKLEV